MNLRPHIEGSLYSNITWSGKRTGIVKEGRVGSSLKSPVVVKDRSECITVFDNLFDTKKAHYMLLEDVIERIKNGNSKDMVQKIRNGNASLKTALPAICFSGIFSQRNDAGLVKHSGLVCLDFDNVPEIEKFKKNICKSEYVRAAFISPSGNGLKVIVRINGDHKKVCADLADHFRSEFLDMQNDICRVCFESNDENIYSNSNSVVFNGRVGE